MQIHMLRRDGTVWAMDVETYVTGLLTRPPNDYMPDASAQALAVIERTWAMYQIVSRPAYQAWDVDWMTLDWEHAHWTWPQHERAVAATRGMIGVHKVEGSVRYVTKGFQCGGHTANPNEYPWFIRTPCPCGRPKRDYYQGACRLGIMVLGQRGHDLDYILNFYFDLNWVPEYGYVVVPPVPVPPPAPPPAPPPWYDVIGDELLDSLGWALYQAAMWFFRISDTIGGVPFLGQYLRWPFEWIGDQLETAALAVWLFAERYKGVTDFVGDLLSGQLLSELLGRLWWDWRTFIDDPAGYVIDIIADYWPEIALLLTDPGSLIEGWLWERVPWLYELLDDPWGWLAGVIEPHWPEWSRFVADPGATIGEWLDERYPGVWQFLSDPDGWLKERIYDLTGLETAFWDDPVGWVRDYVIEHRDTHVENSRAWLYATGERLVRFFFEGVW